MADKLDEIVFSAPDDTGRIIVLTEEHWAHIRERHAEMSQELDAIRVTVTDPHLVCSGNRAVAEIYERFAASKIWPNMLKICRVIVDQMGGEGHITTALFVNGTKWYDQIRHSGPKYDGKVIRDKRDPQP